MIQVDEKELQVVLDLASRTVKTLAEQYALEMIVAKWNQQTKQKRNSESESE